MIVRPFSNTPPCRQSHPVFGGYSNNNDNDDADADDDDDNNN